MVREQKPAGKCPQCGEDDLLCKYNRFESDELRIDSWEHKCANCGFRQTRALRSDELEDEDQAIEPEVCPFCGRTAAED